jgi:hypothetical protein
MVAVYPLETPADEFIDEVIAEIASALTGPA